MLVRDGQIGVGFWERLRFALKRAFGYRWHEDLSVVEDSLRNELGILRSNLAERDETILRQGTEIGVLKSQIKVAGVENAFWSKLAVSNQAVIDARTAQLEAVVASARAPGYLGGEPNV